LMIVWTSKERKVFGSDPWLTRRPTKWSMKAMFGDVEFGKLVWK
jgi:hypothetical protein